MGGILGSSWTFDQVVDSLKRPDGPLPEAKLRPVHTIGTGASGFFEPSDVASRYCIAGHFAKDQPDRKFPVTVRFSNGSGNAVQHDGWSDLRGMATRFHLGNDTSGSEIASDLLAVTVPDFFTPDVETFLGFAKAAYPQDYSRETPWQKFMRLVKLQVPRRNPYTSETLSPDPGALTYANANDFAKLSVFQDASVGAPASFARAAYHAIHTFVVTGSGGEKRWVRFSWLPTLGVLNNDPKDEPVDVYLRDELTQRLAVGPAKFSLMLSIGENGDEFNNSSRAWSFNRRRVFMGTMTIDKVADDQWTNNEHLSYNPCRVVEGIALSDDPILQARKGIYEVSRLRRGAPLCPFSRS